MRMEDAAPPNLPLGEKAAAACSQAKAAQGHLGGFYNFFAD